MLVIKPRGGGRKIYRYGGSGIFDAITKKLFSSGLKTAIKSGAKSAIAQKVADAVVNGANNATKKAVEDTVNDVINNKVKPYMIKKLTGKRKPTSVQDEEGVRKKLKVNINSLIDGSGIVLD